MIICSNKSSEKATKYFSFEHNNVVQNYPVCCHGCIKSAIKKIISGKSMKTVNEDQTNDLVKIPKKIVDDRLKQVLMETRNKKPKKPKKIKSLKKKIY